MKKIVKLFYLMIFLMIFPLADIKAKNVENLVDIDLDYTFNTFDKSNNFTLEFYKQNSFCKFFSYTPFVGLHFNSFTMSGSSISSNFYDFNHWADGIVTNTVLLNCLLLGTPYLVMGVVDVVSCPYLVNYGILLDVHPYVNDYLDTKIGIGIENDPYQVLKYNETTEFFRPFGVFEAEVIGHYKFIKASIGVSYNFDLACKIKDSADLSHWDIDLTFGFNFARKSPASSLDKYFTEIEKSNDSYSTSDEYVADFTI